MAEPRRWEIERDRFGLMVTPEIQIGECVAVVEAAPVDARIAELEADLEYRGKLHEKAIGYENEAAEAVTLRHEVERLRKIEAASRNFIEAEDEPQVSLLFYAGAINALREALER